MSHSSIPASASKEEGEHGKYSEPEDLQEGKLNELESSSDSENDSEMERFQPNTEGIYNDSETKQVLQEMDQVVEDLEKWKQRRREALNADKQSLSAKERQSNTTAYSTTNVSATTGPTQSIESRYNTASKHSMESISRLAATTQDSSLQRQRIGARIPFDKQNALKSEKQLKSYRGSSNIDDEITVSNLGTNASLTNYA